MADDITDVYIATEAGDAGWQSLSALAAAQVEAELPISSADNSVVLDSPSENTFTVSTGGEERFEISSSGAVIQTADMISNGIGIKQELEAKDGSVTNLFGNYVLFSSEQVGGLHDGSWCGYYLHTISTTQSIKEVRGFDVNDQGNAIVSASAFHSAINARAGKDRFAVNAKGSAPSYFGGEIRVPKLIGTSGNDASIELSAELLTTNHTPTQPNSIATVKYVLDNAGGDAYDDTQIKADLASEASAREAADQALQDDINSKAEIWTGTQAEYDALGVYSNYTLYCITD